MAGLFMSCRESDGRTNRQADGRTDGQTGKQSDGGSSFGGSE